MSHLNDEPPLPEDQAETEPTSSSLSMMVTMLLLISGFILAGTMLLHYGAKRADKSGTNDSAEFNFPSLLERSKSYSQNIPNPLQSAETDKDVEKQATPVKSRGLFGSSEENVNWPKLKLTGFGRATEGNAGFAIINGKQFHINQVINGKVRIKEIRSQDVVVEYRGETKRLTVELQH